MPKKIAIVALLASVLLQSLSGFIILVKFYKERDFIAKNLCENRFKAGSKCNGKCHLAKQLKKQETREQKIPGFKLKSIEWLGGSEKQNLKDSNLYFTDQLSYTSKTITYSYLFSSAIFQPPQTA